MTAIPDRLSAAIADRYLIERELGQGGMATVYLAQDVKHDRKVALKVLRPELAAVLGAERFVQEIKTTAALQHPHILPLFDSGQADGFLFYVMPFIDGETLRARLDRETQLGIDEAVKLTTAVAQALDYAHRHEVIHRDIKPLATPFNEQYGALSPDGRWLAYSSDETGRDEVYVRPFPEGEGKTLVSQDGGSEPRWAPDGRELLYVGLRDGLPYLVAARVLAGSEFQVIARAPLFDVSEFEPAQPHANYDISPDGGRFVFVHQGELSEMVFVLNWTEEVRRLSGEGGR